MAKRGPRVSKSPLKVRVQPIKLTKAVKIREIKAQLPGLPKAQGLLDSVALTVRNPFVAGVASCEFMLPFTVNAREDYVSYPNHPPASDENPLSGFLWPMVIVNLTVFHANKAHLLTIYIDSSQDQSYSLTEGVFGNETLQETFAIESGPRTILFAFLPTKSGKQRFAFAPVRPPGESTKDFDFSRLEIDVLL